MNELTIQGESAVAIAGQISTVLTADKEDILGNLSRKIAAFVPDATTESGRDAIRSLAYEVSTSKADLLRLGKKLTEGWRASTKAVNDECKIIEERMDKLKVQVRAPLTEYESIEANRVAAHRTALANIVAPAELQSGTREELAAALATWLRIRQQEPVRDWQEFRGQAEAAIDQVIGQIMRWSHDVEVALKAAADAKAKAEEDALAAVKAQDLREAQIARDAAAAEREAAAEAAAHREEVFRVGFAAEEQARKEAEASREDAELRAQEIAAEAEAERAEAARQAQRAQAKADADQAAAVAAERATLAAEQAEVARQAKAREADTENKRKVNNEILADLVSAGLSQAMAKVATVALIKNNVRNVKVVY